MTDDTVPARRTERGTILLLVDEIRRDGLDQRCRKLIADLSRDVDVVLVAQCYLGRWHPARWLRVRHEFYGFPAEGYDEKVRAFASRLAARHHPSWIIAYGWENSQLVRALDRLDLPVVAFADYRSKAPNAEDQIYWTFRHATSILFPDETIPSSLTRAKWILEARSYRTLAGKEATATLLSVGRNARRGHAQQAHDARVIEAAGGVDADLAIRSDDNPRQATAIYLRASRSTIPRGRIFAGRLLRRPIAGFNPLVYASDNPAFDEANGEDPLAHFIRSGRPAGRWNHDVIRPRSEAFEPPPIAAAIHAHVHYPDLLPELLERLDVNGSRIDLVITTTSDDRRTEIERILAGANLPATIIVAENRGRDLWPFVVLLESGALGAYDVVCHIHGKRSPHYDQGHIWRDFLWTHLIGSAGHHAQPVQIHPSQIRPSQIRPSQIRPMHIQPMADAILHRFAADAQLGLVFAEEPHLEGWELNFAVASDLAVRAGITRPLPYHFDYPMGTMFWARPAALAPLLRLGLTRDDIPEEPLPIDGTVLHALERLIPFLVTEAGYSYATTRVQGSTR